MQRPLAMQWQQNLQPLSALSAQHQHSSALQQPPQQQGMRQHQHHHQQQHQQQADRGYTALTTVDPHHRQHERQGPRRRTKVSRVRKEIDERQQEARGTFAAEEPDADAERCVEFHGGQHTELVEHLSQPEELVNKVQPADPTDWLLSGCIDGLNENTYQGNPNFQTMVEEELSMQLKPRGAELTDELKDKIKSNIQNGRPVYDGIVLPSGKRYQEELFMNEVPCCGHCCRWTCCLAKTACCPLTCFC